MFFVLCFLFFTEVTEYWLNSFYVNLHDVGPVLASNPEIAQNAFSVSNSVLSPVSWPPMPVMQHLEKSIPKQRSLCHWMFCHHLLSYCTSRHFDFSFPFFFLSQHGIEPCLMSMLLFNILLFFLHLQLTFLDPLCFDVLFSNILWCGCTVQQ